jgi:hypothetical protein
MMCNSIKSLLGQIRTEAWEASALYEIERRRWRQRVMSWTVEAIGKNAQAAKARVLEQLTHYETKGTQREVALAIGRVVDLFEIDRHNHENLDASTHLALVIESSGSIDDRGWGQVTIHIRTLTAAALVDLPFDTASAIEVGPGGIVEPPDPRPREEGATE